MPKAKKKEKDKKEEKRRPLSERNKERAEIDRSSASFQISAKHNTMKLKSKEVYNARRCFVKHGPLESIQKRTFTDTRQLELLVAQLILSLAEANSEWRVGTAYAMKEDNTRKAQLSLFSRFRGRVSSALRLPCELCEELVSKDHYQDETRHGCARQAAYIKHQQGYDHLGAPAGVVKEATPV